MSEKDTKMQFVLDDAVLFDVVLLGGLLLLAVVAFNYNPRARSIPLALSVIGSVMVFLQLLVDAFPNLRSKLPFVSESGLLAGERRSPRSGDEGLRETASGGQSSAQPGKESDDSLNVWWRVLRLVLWLAGFIVLLGKIHYIIAVVSFVFLVTCIEAKESWKRAALLAIGVGGGFYMLFDLILKVQI